MGKFGPNSGEVCRENRLGPHELGNKVRITSPPLSLHMQNLSAAILGNSICKPNFHDSFVFSTEEGWKSYSYTLNLHSFHI